MAKLNAMAPDSAGFKVLIKLYQMGGTATVAQLTETLWTEFRSVPRFHQVATTPLSMRGWVQLKKGKGGEKLVITKEGRLMVENYQSLLPRPREAEVKMKPLNPANLRWGGMRPGALDYREMPSLMAGERVPFRGSKEEKAA